MPPTRQKDLADELSDALELCGKRLRTIREEVDGSIALVNIALACVTHLRGAPAVREQLRELLDAQRNRIVQEVSALVESREPGENDAEGPFLFSLVPQQRVARIGRRKIPLTQSEFSVLAHLWERSPEPVSRQDMLDHLYKKGEQPNEAVIDMFIFKIRQKLRTAGCVDVSIDVVRGSGWVLNVAQPVSEAAADRPGTAGPEPAEAAEAEQPRQAAGRP